MRLLPAPVVFLLLLVACPLDPAGLEVEDAWVLGANPMLDVLFVVDDSNSMGAPQAGLASIAPGITAGLTAGGMDWQVGVVTTDMAIAARRGRLVGPVIHAADANGASLLSGQLRPGVTGSQMEQGLASAWAAVTPPLLTHENQGLLRPGARLAVVVLSDEDDCSDEGSLAGNEPSDCVSFPGMLVPIAEYAERLRSIVAVPEDVAVHALVETGLTAEFEGCAGNNVGARYVELARSLGGAVLPHCLDGATMTAELVAQLSDRRTAFPLSRRPDPLSLSVTVTTAEGTQTLREDPTRAAGWTWDEASNSVRLWAGAVAAVGTEVAIRYVVATEG